MSSLRNRSLRARSLLAAGLATSVLAAAVGGAAPAAAATEVEGELTVVVHEAAAGADAQTGTAYLVRTEDGDMLPVESAVAEGVEAGSTVEATVTASGEVTAVAVVAQATAVTASRAHRAYVVVMEDASLSGAVSTTDAVAAVEESTAYWTRESRGAISSFAVASVQTVSLPDACEAGPLWDEAAAIFPGVSFSASSANHMVVIAPQMCEFDYAGVGTIGVKLGGGYSFLPDPLHSAIVHELGHNLGLMHDNLAWGQPRVVEACDEWASREQGCQEYGGYYGPQAFVVGDRDPAALSAAQRYFLGLPGFDARTLELDVTTGVSEATVVTLNATTAGLGTTAVIVEDPASGQHYFIEYRDGSGADAYAPYMAPWRPVGFNGFQPMHAAGVTVTWGDDTGDTYVLPYRDANDYLWTSFQAGDSYTTPDGLVGFDVVSQTASQVVLAITTHPTLGEPEGIVFTDLARNPFRNEIAWLATAGVSTGWATAPGFAEYRPLINVNRDVMAAFLYRFAGKPEFEPPATPTFSDVPTTHVFSKEIEWLATQGITEGWTVDGVKQFRPATAVNRDVMAAFLYRFAGSPAWEGDTQTFVDVPATHVFHDEIEWLASTDIAQGWPVGDATEFRPASAVKRDVMAAFLYRFDAL